MATFVEITPDAFNETFSDTSGDALFERKGALDGIKIGQPHVRRPVRGRSYE